MEPRLDPVEIRVIGSLIEKRVTTPEYYPLTLNALVNACNQTTNRSPVTSYDEGTVGRALLSLDRKGLLWTVQNSRVPKYGERLKEKLNLDGSQLAAMCVLLLRGAQTPGEIRARTGRLHPFASLAEAESALESLARAEPPLVRKLPRLPGTKEARFTQLLGEEVAGEEGEAAAGAPALEPVAPETHPESDRISRLESEIESLRQEFEELRRQVLESKVETG